MSVNHNLNTNYHALGFADSLLKNCPYNHSRYADSWWNEPYSIDRSCWKVGAQVTLLGVRWGKGHWGGFFELGVGHQGVLLGGISYRF